MSPLSSSVVPLLVAALWVTTPVGPTRLDGEGVRACFPGTPAADAAGARARMVLDHNRVLVDAEVQAKDGTWRKARLWIDSGNPDFLLSAAFARSLGFEWATTAPADATAPVAMSPVAVRLAGVSLDFRGLLPAVRPGAEAFLATMHADGNLPSTVLRRYRVVLDYPRREVELRPGNSSPHRGAPVPMRVHPKTGIAQVEARVGGESLSFALDIGASYSFVSARLLDTLAARHGSWPRMAGAVGCANIWGLWPEEERWAVLRSPEIRLGGTTIGGVGLVGLPNIFANDTDLGTWYSRKTAAPVVGFLGPNAFKGFRVEIDYEAGMLHLERHAADDVHDMDRVGLTLQPDGGRWRVLGSAVEGVEAGDVLIAVGEVAIPGATMGTVADSLRGKPGELRVLTLERQGRTIQVRARVRRLL